MPEWLSDNRTWLFAAIGMIVLVAVVAGWWRLTRRKHGAAPAPSAAPPRTGVAPATVETQNTAGTGAPAPIATPSIDARGSQGPIFGATGPITQIFGEDTRGAFAGLQCAYLDSERRICDELPLAKPKADAQRTPRLQRVFVELRTTRPVMPARWFARLGVPGPRQAELQQQLRDLLGVDGRRGRQPDARPELDAPEQAWFMDLYRLDDEKRAAAAKALGVTPAQILAARHPLTPLEHLEDLRVAGQPPHLLLLGDPGGGKSTWVRRLTSVLAWRRLQQAGVISDPLSAPEAAWLAAAERAFGRPVLPIRITMHHWAAACKGQDQSVRGDAADLVAECARVLAAAQPGTALKVVELTHQLLKEGGAVVLLDGLDEVADRQLRGRMVAAVRAFAASALFRATPLVVTCRIKPYERFAREGQAVFGEPAHSCTLGSLDDDAIHEFIDGWYVEMAWAGRGEPAKLQQDARRLHGALPVRQDLQRMAGTPLLLTMMARTNQESGLPDGRAELYENLVQELLWEWEVRRAGAQPDASGAPGRATAASPADDRALLDLLRAASPDLSKARLEQVLNQLAYAVHGAGGDSAVEIERETLEKWLRQLLPCAADDAAGKARATALATNVVNFIGQRTGLLADIEDGQRFRFTHYTFQEYLAARWMATGSYGVRLQKLQEKVDDVHWREAVFLAIGCMVSTVREAYDDALVIIGRLLHEPPQREQDWVRLLLVGEAFVRQFTPEKLALATDATGRSETLALVAARLRTAMQQPALAPADRLAAGLLLDDLRTRHGLAPAGLDDFIAVPNSNFFVGKYPVTNRQFRRFVDAGGYGKRGGRRPQWWSERGWPYRQRNGWTEPRYWDDRKYSWDTQPVVGVSLYEAEAYCNWLNGSVSASRLPGGASYLPVHTWARLPTQDEWMQAAHNGEKVVRNNVEDYPWIGRFDKALANTKESNFRQTTPVDMYPNGASPAGVFDLAGNVWEWTADTYDKDSDRFWLKGGSWYDGADQARASAAGCSAADFRSFGWLRGVNLGFRVFCVPISHG